MKKIRVTLVYILVFSILVGCSNGITKSDEEASEKGILSKDDAEVLIYNRLSGEEKEEYTVDYLEEKGTKYIIRVYKSADEGDEVRAKYSVDYNTEEVKEISDN